MKKVFLIIALVVAGLTTKAQVFEKKDIPSDVTSAFSKKYMDVNMNDVNWDRKQDGYKAAFSKGDKDYEVLFDNTGKWITTEVDDLSFNDLPEKVKKGINKKGYSPDKLRNIQMSETQKETTYEMEVKEGTMKYHKIYLNKEGNVIKENI